MLSYPVHAHTAPFFLNLETRWSWAVKLTAQPLYPWKIPRYPMNKGTGWIQSRAWWFKRRENLLPLLGFAKSRLSSPYAIAIPTMLSQWSHFSKQNKTVCPGLIHNFHHKHYSEDCKQYCITLSCRCHNFNPTRIFTFLMCHSFYEVVTGATHTCRANV